MNRQRDVDQLLRTWLEDGLDQAPERFVWAALEQVDRAPQRGAWRVSLEGFLMRFQPAAPILGVAAVAIAAVALYVAFAGGNVGDPGPTDTPAPSPSMTLVSGAFATSVFEVPFTATLEFAASPDGWGVQEGQTVVSLSPDPGSAYDVLVLSRSSTLLLTEDGEEPLSTDLVGALNRLDGIEAQQLLTSDRGEPATFEIDGVEAPHVEVRLAARANGAALFRTDGGEVERPGADATWWLFDVDRAGGADVLVIYRGSDDPSLWFGTVAGFLESITFADGS
jgi:hypothetical protein